MGDDAAPTIEAVTAEFERRYSTTLTPCSLNQSPKNPELIPKEPCIIPQRTLNQSPQNPESIPKES